MTGMHILPGAFSTPTQVGFGEGVSAKAGEIAKGMGATRVFVVTDPGVAKAGILSGALDSIHEAGLALTLFDQAPLDPTLADAQRIGEAAKAFGADLVIAAGGGSGLCAGRSAAMAATNGDLRGCTGHEKYANDPLPVIAIPTTAGSGSEVSKHVTLTDERTGRKTGIDGYTNAPKVALLDPALVQGVPRAVAVASGIDAFLHALEAYLSTRATPLTDAIALDAFERIWDLLPRALAGDARAKGDMLFASSTANIACGNAGLTLVHAMNGGVTYCFKARGHQPVAYGMIHGALMPPILRFFIPAAAARFARLGPIVGVANGDPAAVVETIVAWARACGAPPTLPWGRIPDADIDLIVEETLARQRPSPRQPTRDEARAIVLEALGVA
jgi:alcohol dehydrogenase class IV